jgi:hypothetical protein
MGSNHGCTLEMKIHPEMMKIRANMCEMEMTVPKE